MALVAALLAGLAVAVGPAGTAGAADIPRPRNDPFYKYDESKLVGKRPGAILRTRQVDLALGVPGVSTATQILYRTTDSLGEPSYSVTTVVLPLTGTTGARMVSYQSFYDALAAKCAPSYTLRGGDPGAANQELTQIESGVVAGLVTSGYVVNVPDFENHDLHWVAGIESGRSTIDSIKAAQDYLELPRSTPLAMMGYSGGSIGSEWAAELQPHRAPRLNLVGVAAGGMPVHLANNLRYVNGTPVWSSVAPGALVGIARGYEIRLRRYLTDFGRKIVRKMRYQCIGEFSGAYPGLLIRQVIKRRYLPVFQVPIFRRTVNRLIMGSIKGHPTTPLFFGAGIHDGIGDDVMIKGDQEALAHQYCEQGVDVQFQVFDGLDHGNAGLAFLSSAQAWIAARFVGGPPPNNCSQIGEGSSIDPVP